MAFVVEETHSAPTIITLTQAKKQLQFDAPADEHEDDDVIQEMIDEAIEVAENIINSEIKEKVFTITGKSFEDVFTFKRQIITNVESFTYKDANGNSQTINASNYSLQKVDKYENKIVFNEDFTIPDVKKYDPAAVSLQVKVGYANGKTPKTAIRGIKLLIADFYKNRYNTVQEKRTAAEHILQSLRRY